MKPIRVLLVYHNASSPSAQSLFSEIGKEDDITLRVLAPARGWDPMNKRQVVTQPLSCDEYTLVTGRVFKAWKDYSKPYIFGLEREMLVFRPHIIHIFYEATSKIVLQTLLYRKILLPRARVLYFGFENIFPDEWFKKPYLRRYFWKFACRELDGGVYANSEGLKRLQELGLSANNSEVIYWGVPLEKFGFTDPSELKEEMGLSGKYIIGYVGRLEEGKGLETAIRALSLLPDDSILYFLGSGEEEGSLRSLASEMGLDDRVTFTSRVPEYEVPRHMSTFDILILPSESTGRWKEQFGRVIPEAMACTIPIIGSDSGAIPEVLGRKDVIFKEGDSEDLAEKISFLRGLPEEERRKMINKNEERAWAHFSLQGFSNKIHSFYRNLMNIEKPRAMAG